MYETLSNAVIAPFLFRESFELQNKIRLEAIKKNFTYHYEKNEYFRSLCNASHVSPESITEFKDLIKIPLIPLRSFKQPDPDARYLLSISLDEVDLEIRSSGTGGIKSVARRDADTVSFVTLFYISLFRDFLKIQNGAGLYLVPSPAEVPDMGMIKTFTLLNYAFGVTSHAVEKLELNSEKAIRFLKEWEGKLPRYIMTPPFMLNIFLNYLIEHNIKIKLDKESKIITVGGWKHHTGNQISREKLDQKCIDYLGVDKGQIRDFYAMVESNFMGFECEHNHKHVPVPMHLSVRDYADPSKEAKEGEEGYVAILDPICLSYPAFLLTEDMGVIRKNVKCECGRCSDVIEKIGRVPKSDMKTCALTLEQFMDERQK